jgi:hypothetical protein
MLSWLAADCLFLFYLRTPELQFRYFLQISNAIAKSTTRGKGNHDSLRIQREFPELLQFKALTDQQEWRKVYELPSEFC